ncbi:PTS sugar transporter subunit IIA [Lentibacillus sp. L22]|uniref:PTS sugar transporter subunit IIA n=1 Tax=Lentibacillus sp. L22 TaxID=3163028 RepID=UPI003465743F
MNNLLDLDLIFTNANASSYSDVFEKMGSTMIKKGYANDDYIEGLLSREKEFSTGVPVEPVGIAIPHTDASYVRRNKIGIMTLENPVKFGVMGGSAEDVMDVKLVILLCFANGNEHLKALQNIIQMIQDVSFVEKIMNASDRNEVYKIMVEKLNHVKEEEK